MMAVTDNVTRGELAALVRRVRQLENATPLASTSVGRGRVRMYDGSELLIEDGNLTVSGSGSVTGTLTVSGEEDVTGTLKVLGTLEADGTITFTGTFTATGTTDLNGPVNIGGNAKVTGTLEIDGATTLKDDLTVVAGGGITIDSANPLKLSPDGTHAIEWQSGAYLISNDGGVGMGASGHSSAVNAAVDGSAVLFYAGGAVAVWTDSTGVRFYSPDGTKVMQLTNAGLVGP